MPCPLRCVPKSRSCAHGSRARHGAPPRCLHQAPTRRRRSRRRLATSCLRARRSEAGLGQRGRLQAVREAVQAGLSCSCARSESGRGRRHRFHHEVRNQPREVGRSLGRRVPAHREIETGIRARSAGVDANAQERAAEVTAVLAVQVQQDQANAAAKAETFAVRRPPSLTIDSSI
jgi:hypothetical protein